MPFCGCFGGSGPPPAPKVPAPKPSIYDPKETAIILDVPVRKDLGPATDVSQAKHVDRCTSNSRNTTSGAVHSDKPRVEEGSDLVRQATSLSDDQGGQLLSNSKDTSGNGPSITASIGPAVSAKELSIKVGPLESSSNSRTVVAHH